MSIVIQIDTDREASLLQQINLDIAPEQWQSYLKLKEKHLFEF